MKKEENDKSKDENSKIDGWFAGRKGLQRERGTEKLMETRNGEERVRESKWGGRREWSKGKEGCKRRDMINYLVVWRWRVIRRKN